MRSGALGARPVQGSRDAHGERRAGRLGWGERLHAALACDFAVDPAPELLIFAEPTNRASLCSLEQLDTAFAIFDGALLVVTHEVGFLERFGIDVRVALPGPARTATNALASFRVRSRE